MVITRFKLELSGLDKVEEIGCIKIGQSKSNNNNKKNETEIENNNMTPNKQLHSSPN